MSHTSATRSGRLHRRPGEYRRAHARAAAATAERRPARDRGTRTRSPSSPRSVRTLRRYDVGGRPVLDGFDEPAIADGGRGQVLAPWPNRVADGRWTWGGKELQLPLIGGRQSQRHPRAGPLGRLGARRARRGRGDDGDDRVAEPGLPVPARDDRDLPARRRRADDAAARPQRGRPAGAVRRGPAPLPHGRHRAGRQHRCSRCRPGPGCSPTSGATRRVARTSTARRTTSGSPARSATWCWTRRTPTCCRATTAGCGCGWNGRTAAASSCGPARPPDGCRCSPATPSLPDRRRLSAAVEPMSCPPGALASGDDLVVLDPGRGARPGVGGPQLVNAAWTSGPDMS